MSLRGSSFATWNHRVLRHEDGTSDAYFAIHECHYSSRSKGIPHSWTENPIPVLEETMPSMRKTLERMQRACELPILVIRGNKLEEWQPETQTAYTGESRGPVASGRDDNGTTE